jgi:hypothetical protein
LRNVKITKNICAYFFNSCRHFLIQTEIHVDKLDAYSIELRNQGYSNNANVAITKGIDTKKVRMQKIIQSNVSETIKENIINQLSGGVSYLQSSYCH